MGSARKRAVKGKVGAVAVALSLCGAAALGFAWSFSSFLDRVALHEPTPERRADGAVALTGGADRISDAVELLARGRVDRLLITGVNPATTRDEIARAMPTARALFDCCIALGYEAANTVGNAAETGRWARAHHIRSLIVVTSDYHMPRALAEMGSALPGVELVAHPVVPGHGRHRPWWGDGTTARLLVWEWAKYSAATLRIGFSFPRPAAPADAADVVATQG